MSMTSSMCVSMTGRPTRLQIANEQRRQRYDYLQTAEDEDYTPSATRGDYSPSNPWDTPGMSISDFI